MSICLLSHHIPSAYSVAAAIPLVIWVIILIRRSNFYEKAYLLLQHQQLDIQEAERKRIADDIHDEIGSSLAAIKINLQSLHYTSDQDKRKARRLLQLVDETSDNVRRATHNLMPPLFGATPLTLILQEHFASMETESGIIFHCCCNTYMPFFDPRQELIMYRIVMELTCNIIRHSYATAATVQLLYFPTYLEILIEDDGIGLPENNDQTRGIGLKSVYSRVKLLHGKITVDTGRSGTTFIINIPSNVGPR
jgi:signal transduction histidine kinase